MHSLKASLKALVNLTNIPRFEPEENGSNPKGNMTVKRELLLDKSPSSGRSPSRLRPRANPEPPPSTTGLLGMGSTATKTRQRDSERQPGTTRSLPISRCAQSQDQAPESPVPPPPGPQVRPQLLSVSLCEPPGSAHLLYPRRWRSKSQGPGCRVCDRVSAGHPYPTQRAEVLTARSPRRLHLPQQEDHRPPTPQTPSAPPARAPQTPSRRSSQAALPGHQQLFWAEVRVAREAWSGWTVKPGVGMFGLYVLAPLSA